MARVSVALAVLLTLALTLAPRALRAEPSLTPITDRDFTLDLYFGGVMASHRIVGMGGAALALAEGGDYMTLQPAAVAARPATVNDAWDWDFHLDKLEPGLGADADGNGLREDAGELTLSSAVGLMFFLGRFGVGLTVTEQRVPVTLPAPAAPLEFSVQSVRLEFGWAFGVDRQVAVGAALRSGGVTLRSAESTIVNDFAASFEVGALWRPPGADLRLGLRAGLPVSSRLDSPTCDPLDCRGYILPDRLEFPWSVGAGAAYRFGPTPWNRRVQAAWRDERALIVAADLIVTGAVEGGANVESFTNHQLQRSGSQPDLSLRLGADYEWPPGWLRVRGGAYYDPARVAGVPGRLHATAGFDVRLFAFRLWGDDYRARFSAAVDGAHAYLNVVASLGLWH